VLTIPPKRVGKHQNGARQLTTHKLRKDQRK